MAVGHSGYRGSQVSAPGRGFREPAEPGADIALGRLGQGSVTQFPEGAKLHRIADLRPPQSSWPRAINATGAPIWEMHRWFALFVAVTCGAAAVWFAADGEALIAASTALAALANLVALAT